MSGLYNLINGVNPATFVILPMLGKHPDDYPRFRDCALSEDGQRIIILLRVGGRNRNCGYGEEKMYKDPNFIKTYDAEWDDTYGYYEFKIPDIWKEDLKKILKGNKPSEQYIQQACKVYPKIADKLHELFNKMIELLNN